MGERTELCSCRYRGVGLAAEVSVDGYFTAAEPIRGNLKVVSVVAAGQISIFIVLKGVHDTNNRFINVQKEQGRLTRRS